MIGDAHDNGKILNRITDKLARPQRLIGLWTHLKSEPVTLALLLLIAASLWAFAALADEVVEGSTRQFDRSVLLMMRTTDDLTDPIGPRWLEEAMRDLTALGGLTVTTLLTFATVVWLYFRGRRVLAVLMLSAVLGGLLISFALKTGFDRPRPDLVPHGSIVYTHSFPSAHSMTAAVTYLTLGSLIARAERRRSMKWFMLALATILTVLVGISRVYLGVHWPTDVLAGWTLGTAWALLAWLAAEGMLRFAASRDRREQQRLDQDAAS